MLSTIKRLQSELSNFIEPDVGLLDQLLSLEVLTRRQYDDVRYETIPPYRRSEAVLDLLTSEDQCDKFIKALKKTGQQHVVNYITQNGGRKRCFYIMFAKADVSFETVIYNYSHSYVEVTTIKLL